MKLHATKEVRVLLYELDGHMRRFHECTAKLADRTLGDVEAVNLGADREQIRSMIVGCAYRINQASRKGKSHEQPA